MLPVWSFQFGALEQTPASGMPRGKGEGAVERDVKHSHGSQSKRTKDKIHYFSVKGNQGWTGMCCNSEVELRTHNLYLVVYCFKALYLLSFISKMFFFLKIFL